MAMIGTLYGDMPEEELTKTVVREKVPCGVSVTTTYHDAIGRLVRQDVEIQVDKGALIGGRTGEMK